MNENKNAGDWVRAEMARDPALAEAISKYGLNSDIALQILHFRSLAGLTQKELAEKSGTKQSVISRIEDDDYDGHSLKLLHKIAWALDLELLVKFCERNKIAHGNQIPCVAEIHAAQFPSNLTQAVFDNTENHHQARIGSQWLQGRPSATSAPAEYTGGR